MTTREGTVRIGPEAVIHDDVSGEFVEVHHDATVKRGIRATEETSMVSEEVIEDSVVPDPVGAEPDAPAENDEPFGPERPDPSSD